jgi:isopenicillin-N N-acyltransferase like protein
MLPVIQLSGSPYQQGLQHGTQLKAAIGENLATYFYRFELEAKLSRPEVLERAGRLLAVIERLSQDYYDGMRGIATGAGFDLLEIAALNVRYEILYYQFGQVALAEQAAEQAAELAALEHTRERLVDGCTLFAVSPNITDTGHLLVGQNWDWIPTVRGAVLYTKHDDGLVTLAFTEAGIFGGKIGLNSAGVGICINGITTTDDDWSRPVSPTHVRCYNVLRSRSFDEMQQVIKGELRACSTNFLIAQAPDQALNIEAAPNQLNELQFANGCITHANHFVAPDALGIIEPPSERRQYSRHREQRLRDLLESKHPLSVADIQEFLRDTDGYPNSVSRHADPDYPPEEHYVTVTGVVMDLNTLEMWISDGPPDQNPFQYLKIEA